MQSRIRPTDNRHALHKQKADNVDKIIGTEMKISPFPDDRASRNDQNGVTCVLRSPPVNSRSDSWKAGRRGQLARFPEAKCKTVNCKTIDDN